jgi:N-acetyl-anhydromuramyl-L-alanine amidase AmpD
MTSEYRKAIWKPAAEQNFSSRPYGSAIDCVVLHATAGGLTGTLAWFRNPGSGVSAHYVVAKEGTVYQMVAEAMAAHHAGASSYQGRTGFNDFSIGIEIVNRNDGLDPYPPAQFEAVADLVAYLVDRYGIQPAWVVTHAQVSTAGKTDPRGFPMAELLKHLYGLVADPPEEMVRDAAWGAIGIPLNPSAAFPRYARDRELGCPRTGEFDFDHDGAAFRGQGFARAIVYARRGDWERIREVSW